MNKEPTDSPTSPPPATATPPITECGLLGGRGVLDAFGRAGEGLLPDLVANWVTGHATQRAASEYVGGGVVTSTVIYCWMAAVVRIREPRGDEEEEEDEETPDMEEMLCTGSLVATDAIITSAECMVQ